METFRVGDMVAWSSYELSPGVGVSVDTHLFVNLVGDEVDWLEPPYGLDDVKHPGRLTKAHTSMVAPTFDSRVEVRAVGWEVYSRSAHDRSLVLQSATWSWHFPMGSATGRPLEVDGGPIALLDVDTHFAAAGDAVVAATLALPDVGCTRTIRKLTMPCAIPAEHPFSVRLQVSNRYGLVEGAFIRCCLFGAWHQTVRIA